MEAEVMHIMRCFRTFIPYQILLGLICSLFTGN